jgi:hypothetical protein
MLFLLSPNPNMLESERELQPMFTP